MATGAILYAPVVPFEVSNKTALSAILVESAQIERTEKKKTASFGDGIWDSFVYKAVVFKIATLCYSKTQKIRNHVAEGLKLSYYWY